jgi:hypothetical protein
MSRYPRDSANEIAEWILEEKAPIDRHKILFDLQHDDFMRSITRREVGDTVETQIFLLLIKSSPIMREWRYYRRYRQLLRAFIKSFEDDFCLDRKILETYSSLERSDKPDEAPGSEALSGLDELAFRKLLLEPIYFFTIIRHAHEAVWAKVLQNLDIPGIAVQCLRDHNINPNLFEGITDKGLRLFQDVDLKKHWALNRQAGRILSKGEWILRGLAREAREDLEEVADSKTAANSVRQRARAILKEGRPPGNPARKETPPR